MNDPNTVVNMEVGLYNAHRMLVAKWLIPHPSKELVSELGKLLSRKDEPRGATSAHTNKQECCGADDWGLTSNDMCKDCPKRYTLDGRNSADKHTSQINDLELVVLSQGKAIGALQALIEKQNAILDDAAASIQSLCAIAEAHQERLDLQVACLEVVANLLKARR